MAPPLSLMSRAVTLLTQRRGYAAASAVNRVVTPAEDKVLVTRTKSVDGLVDDSSSSWVPDPVSGYYRPANCAEEVDPAAMREMLLSNRSRR